jgi:phosphomannomutase
MSLACFKSYDVRGRLGDEINEDIAYRIGRAYGLVTKAKNVVVGGDARATSDALKMALSNGLRDAGVNVVDLGLVGTEEIYFATSDLNMDGGIVVTASHNPIDYNGMKLVSANSKPISRSSGLDEIEKWTESQPWLNTPLSANLSEKSSANLAVKKARGGYRQLNHLTPYVNHLMGYITPRDIKPLKLVVNAGNGAAGHVIDEIERQFSMLNVDVQFIKIHHHPDPSFPHGIPNPLLTENRQSTIDAILAHNADMGIAWDGDFDRCFLFDETGAFVEGYYIVGLLAQAFLQHEAGAKIIHDPRLTWNTIELVEQSGGEAVLCKTGHAFIKERMRQEDAVYGGEMSAHHYFRDFFYCDSGMIPWLLVIELLSINNMTLSTAVNKRIDAYPSSGEINLILPNPQQSIDNVLTHYLTHSSTHAQSSVTDVDYTDGISMSLVSGQQQWRFNLRSSNTEPVVRLNVESKGNVQLMENMTRELLTLLKRDL